ncbi:unnamed protein product [Spirodela intermedia]|uniref:aldehyde oxygenase (deformylating) n=2 Tax=Spirodela intermedia TaxID=51605 RepID=A0A7I8J4J9_SPIIN|nr:unnamed protein product [Spirodela intermedia]CAA6665168.1 unnamed protein product [Spirodela intermedia]CAA7401897.1 unnamed protein product [Spirodela intermedia]
MDAFAAEELQATFVPIVVYWLYAGLYTLAESSERYRLHTRKEQEAKDLVRRKDVVIGVLLQQAIQSVVALATLRLAKEDNTAAEKPKRTFPTVMTQLLIAMVVMDTWQYFVHRLMHINRFLYKHFHSKHHAIIVPYAVGAMYNHPVEGFFMDTIGGALSFLVSGMSPLAGTFFFSFTMKTVDDHCGMRLPWNPLQALFMNNSAYHDIHHQHYGSKFNFSQPFFVSWDRIMRTYMPCSRETKKKSP